jgi:hypothetical protein
MVTRPLLDELLQLLERLPHVHAVILFGSRARAMSDRGSDVDLQIVTAKPRYFLNSAWVEPGALRLISYGVRPASSGVTKASIVFHEGEADLVIVPFRRVMLARALVAAGIHRRSRSVQFGLEELARIFRPGHQVLLGGDPWKAFYRRVVAEVPEPRLSERQVHDLGSCAYADYLGLRPKCQRGELLAAQRALHVSLAETAFRLLHELRVQRQQVTFRDARRLEKLLSADELTAITFSAALVEEEILQAGKHLIQTIRQLVVELTSREPTWPPVQACSTRFEQVGDHFLEGNVLDGDVGDGATGED